MATPLTTIDFLTRAKWRASSAAPYLAKAIWACTWIDVGDAIPTAGIDKNWRVYYNPEYIQKCASDNTLVGEVIHEVLHPLKRNWQREEALEKLLGHVEHQRANACQDAENDVNIEELRSRDGSPVKLVTNRVTPEKLGGQRGMVFEELYKISKEKNPTKVVHVRCSGGSGCGGKPMPWEVKAKAKADQDKKVGLTEAQSQLLQAQVAEAIKEAEGKRPGSVPGGLVRWSETILQGAPVPWEDMVSAKISYNVSKRRGIISSFDRPSRRLSPFVLPVHRAAQVKLTLVVDTSGSMGETDIGKALGTVADACLALGQVQVVACDAAPQMPVEVRSLDDLREFLKGGGGTDMVAGIRAAEETSPDLVIVVTDGYTDWPSEEGSTPVMAALTQKGRAGQVPSWIEVVEAFD